MKLSRSKQFKKDLRQYATKMGDKHFEMLVSALSLLLDNEPLPPHYKDHRLGGRLNAYREFHIGGDLLVMYAIEEDVVYLMRIGTHAEILGM